MKIDKTIFEFYINSSIHVALAVVSLCLITFFHFEITPDIGLLSYVFFGTITGYNFVKYAGIAKLHHRSLATGLQWIQIFSFFSFVIFVFTALEVGWKILIWTGVFGLLTLLYALPVFSENRNLRSITGVKIFIIATVWAGVTVVLPVSMEGEVQLLTVVLEVVQRFLLVLVWILPFEIRDLKYDLQELGTIPQRVGVTKTKILGLVLLAAAVFVEIWKEEFIAANFLAILITAGISAGFVWKTKERQGTYYSSFWVEAIPLFWMTILLLIRSI
jgi:hypothetical protein